MEEVTIRPIKQDEWDNAMELAFRVFLKFESKEYGKEGTEAFAQFVTDENLRKAFLAGQYPLFAAYMADELIGIVALRSGNHLSLLFVDGRYHNQGIGTKLLNYAIDYMHKNTIFTKITVNAAPFAAGFYHGYGFHDTAPETEKDGIIYIPMEKMI